MTELAILAEPPVPLPPIEIKALVRHRDGYRCTDCGLTAAEHLARYGANLEVHRLTPGSPYTLAGCVALCRECHYRKPKCARGTSRRGVVVVTLPGPLREALLQYAAEHHCPVVSVFRTALRKFLDAKGFSAG